MNAKLFTDGILLGIKEMGGEIVNIDNENVLIEIKKDTKLDSEDARKRLSELLKDLCGLTLKFKTK